MNTSEKIVYLTFDDGPHPDITRFVMDELEKHQFKGTFFCIGNNVVKHRETFDEVTIRGHAVGNHTFNHLNGWKTKPLEYIQDIQRCAELVQGVNFRPPYGRITRAQRRSIGGKFKIIMWSLLSWDFKPGLNTDRSLRNLKRYTSPGVIVVFHDSEKADRNLRAILPPYLDFLHEQGYKTGVFV